MDMSRQLLDKDGRESAMIKSWKAGFMQRHIASCEGATLAGSIPARVTTALPQTVTATKCLPHVCCSCS